MQFDKEKIKIIINKFLEDRAEAIRHLKLEYLNINPFLIRTLAKQMRFKDSRSIVEWMVTQRSMTGANTSFGFILEKIAKLFSESTGVEGADIFKTKDKRHYHIQVKSGPTTMDKDAVQHMSKVLQSVQRRNHGSVAMLGMCYGTKEQVNSAVKLYSGVDWKVGKEFWGFISDDPECMNKIYEVAGEVGRTFKDKHGQSLSDIIESKVEELTRKFEEIYGAKEKDIWKNLLEKNS